MSLLVVGLVVVTVLLVAALAALGLSTERLRSARRELEATRAELAAATTPDPSPVPRSMRNAERLVRTVVGTAARVREQGVGGLLLESMDELSRWALEDRSEITRIAARDGTVTVFFSDIEDSTALNSRLGDDSWVRLLIAHDVQVRAHVERRQGHIVKSQGDGFMVVFSSPVDAVKAGLGIQRSLSDLRGQRWGRSPIRVRIGIHEGTAIARDGDLFGQTVATAARIGAQAEGGELLVSESVAASLRDDARFDLASKGAVELKGLPGAHELYAVSRHRLGS